MKKIIIMALAMTIATAAFPQKKKELAERITQMETEIEEMKGSIDKLQGSIKLLNDANTLLEKQLKFQEEINNSQSETIKQLQKDLVEAKRQSVAADPTALITDPQNEEDSIISLVQHYYGAKKWEDRLPLVYKSDKYKGNMAKYYADSFKRNVVDKNTVSIPGSGYKVGDKFGITAKSSKGASMGPIFIRKTAEGFKVDWMATTGYDEETLDNYSNRQGIEKKIVHIDMYECRVDDTWENYGLKNKYYTVGELYIAISSPAGKRMAQLMKESPNGKRLVVEVEGKIVHNKDNYDYTHYFVFVNRIVKEDWYDE